jgi:hypothetical protein
MGGETVGAKVGSPDAFFLSTEKSNGVYYEFLEARFLSFTYKIFVNSVFLTSYMILRFLVNYYYIYHKIILFFKEFTSMVEHACSVEHASEGVCNEQ